MFSMQCELHAELMRATRNYTKGTINKICIVGAPPSLTTRLRTQPKWNANMRKDYLVSNRTRAPKLGQMLQGSRIKRVPNINRIHLHLIEMDK